MRELLAMLMRWRWPYDINQFWGHSSRARLLRRGD
jgi:hypothetical protein